MLRVLWVRVPPRAGTFSLMFILLVWEVNGYALDAAIQGLQARPSGKLRCLTPKCYDRQECSGLSAWTEQDHTGSSVSRVLPQAGIFFSHVYFYRMSAREYGSTERKTASTFCLHDSLGLHSIMVHKV